MHTNNQDMVEYFAKRVPVSRLCVNTPSALGGIGGTTGLLPSLTLGCGAIGGSATSENVGPLDLVNLRYVAIGMLEIEDIRASLPDCSSGICVMKNADAAPAPAAAPAASLNEDQMDILVRKIIEKLQNA
jgi:hypothetical protein